jgi:AcrR family transcriptional regulator
VTDTRDRLISASAELFRRQGYVGTGVKEIIDAASAPFGSLYHFFPNGKEELGAATVRWSGAVYGGLIDLFYEPGDDPVLATRRFFDSAADTVRDSAYADACPIATVALEVASTSEPLRLATADVFEEWLTALTNRFVEAGLTKAQARRLSVSLFCLLEGSFILARATRDETHVRTAGRAAADAVRAALDHRAAQLRTRQHRE